jgi:hypothetical protein
VLQNSQWTMAALADNHKVVLGDLATNYGIQIAQLGSVK